MPSGTGTGIFQKKWPERFFDVGIAEGHAVTFAGGLATQGVRPVCAIYSTFLQRAYDNIIHDVAVQHLPVVFCMDRAGLGRRGRPDPHGTLRHRLHACGPRDDGDGAQGRRRAHRTVRTALDHNGPFCDPLSPRQGPAEPAPAGTIPAVPFGTWEVLRAGKDVALLAVGTMVQPPSPRRAG